jgi:hypothetical protein
MEPQGCVEAHRIEKLFLKAPLVENGNKERDTSADSIFKVQRPSSSAFNASKFVPIRASRLNMPNISRVNQSKKNNNNLTAAAEIPPPDTHRSSECSCLTEMRKHPSNG